MSSRRTAAQAAAVGTVYRHVCADAAAAAICQDWNECTRLMHIARSLERSYPVATARARFSARAHVDVTRHDESWNRDL